MATQKEILTTLCERLGIPADSADVYAGTPEGKIAKILSGESELNERDVYVQKIASAFGVTADILLGTAPLVLPPAVTLGEKITRFVEEEIQSGQSIKNIAKKYHLDQGQVNEALSAKDSLPNKKTLKRLFTEFSGKNRKYPNSFYPAPPSDMAIEREKSRLADELKRQERAKVAAERKAARQNARTANKVKDQEPIKYGEIGKQLTLDADIGRQMTVTPAADSPNNGIKEKITYIAKKENLPLHVLLELADLPSMVGEDLPDDVCTNDAIQKLSLILGVSPEMITGKEPIPEAIKTGYFRERYWGRMFKDSLNYLLNERGMSLYGLVKEALDPAMFPNLAQQINTRERIPSKEKLDKMLRVLGISIKELLPIPTTDINKPVFENQNDLDGQESITINGETTKMVELGCAAENIKTLCEEERISLTALSRLLGIEGKSNQMNYLNRKFMPKEMLDKCAKILGVTAEDLLDDVTPTANGIQPFDEILRVNFNAELKRRRMLRGGYAIKAGMDISDLSALIDTGKGITKDVSSLEKALMPLNISLEEILDRDLYEDNCRQMSLERTRIAAMQTRTPRGFSDNGESEDISNSIKETKTVQTMADEHKAQKHPIINQPVPNKSTVHTAYKPIVKQPQKNTNIFDQTDLFFTTRPATMVNPEESKPLVPAHPNTIPDHNARPASSHPTPDIPLKEQPVTSSNTKTAVPKQDKRAQSIVPQCQKENDTSMKNTDTNENSVPFGVSTGDCINGLLALKKIGLTGLASRARILMTRLNDAIEEKRPLTVDECKRIATAYGLSLNEFFALGQIPYKKLSPAKGAIFALNLSAAMRQKGMDVHELSAATKIRENELSAWLWNLTHVPPSYEQFKTIATVLGCEITWLLQNNEKRMTQNEMRTTIKGIIENAGPVQLDTLYYQVKLAGLIPERRY